MKGVWFRAKHVHVAEQVFEVKRHVADQGVAVVRHDAAAERCFGAAKDDKIAEFQASTILTMLAGVTVAIAVFSPVMACNAQIALPPLAFGSPM